MAKLAAGRLVSEVGSRITREGQPVAAILAASASTAELGLLAGLSMLPALVLGAGAGLFADRRHRRPLTIAADVLRAALLATVPAAALLGGRRSRRSRRSPRCSGLPTGPTSRPSPVATG